MSKQELITFFPMVSIEHNFGIITLKDATWTAYPQDKDHYNEDGANGFLIGTVVSGHSTSRILHYTSTTHEEVGVEKRIDYAHQSKLRNHKDYNPIFNLTFCG